RLTSLTRPEQMYLSQGLIAFASALFLPAAMLAGFSRAMRQGQEFIVSFAVIFGAGQSLGALIGSAFLGTLLTIRQRAYTSQIVEHLTLADPQVVTRLRQYSGAHAGSIVDPALRQAEGVALLSQVVTREATALAYGDLFRVIAVLALLVFFYLLAVRMREDARARRAAALIPAEATT
ncbi:MAG: putative transporter, partial [Phenylobacterium sp.]|nr:putative transporter [Phenylobacterium sp.]